VLKGKLLRRRSEIVADLDRLYRKIRKLEWADGSDYCRCYTCRQLFRRTEIEVGHFDSRRFVAIRWDDRNTRPQCHLCNQAQAGAEGATKAKAIRELYRMRLEAEIGAEALASLEAGKTDKVPTCELEALVDIMRARLKDMEGKR
jgi:hypothetical protein